MIKKNLNRRKFIKNSLALSLAGWLGGTSTWLLKPKWSHAAGPIKIGIATDITGAIAFAGNPNWQTAQLVAEQINESGGILGRPVELILEDTASDPGVAVGNVRRLIQQGNVDVVIGGITSAMREAIKNPIVKRGKTLYLYPQLYEGQECTEHLYCTGPTPFQQISELIPFLIKKGNKRFAMPSANYLWPQLLNKWTRNSIEENGGEVVLEEYFPLDQMEYSATIGKIKKEKVDHVFNTIIPPGLSGFTKQLYESGFQSNGGSQSCVYWDENTPFYVAPEELEGAYSCLDFFHNVNDAYGQKLLKDYSTKWKDTQYQFTAGSAATGMYRAIRLYEQAVIATNGDLKREAVSSALEKVSLADGPGGGYSVVPGTGHISMNMYIAQAQKGKWNILSETKSVPPNECA